MIYNLYSSVVILGRKKKQIYSRKKEEERKEMELDKNQINCEIKAKETQQ